MAASGTFDRPAGGVAVTAWPDLMLDWSAAAAMALLPFQNSFLQLTPLGGFGAALSLVPVMVFAFFAALKLASRADRVTLPSPVVAGALYILLITVGGLLAYDFSYKGVSLTGKAVLATVQWGFLGVGLAAGARCPPALARAALTLAWLINIVGLLVLGGSPEAVGDAYKHIGFSSEPSHFGLVTAIIGLLLAFLTEARPLRWLVLGSTVVTILVSGSKGALAVLGLVIVVAGLVAVRHDRRRLLQTVPVLLIGAGGLFAVAVSRIQYDIANFTSTVTRLSGVLTAIRIANQHPLGVGLGGFYPAFAMTVPQTWPAIKALFGINVNFSEMLAFAYSDDRNLSAKAFLFDTMIYFGWPGAIVLLALTGGLTWYWLTAARPRSLWLAMALCFAVLAMSTYNTIIPMYVIPMTFGFAWRARTR